jgi:hypothetical protein
LPRVCGETPRPVRTAPRDPACHVP